MIWFGEVTISLSSVTDPQGGYPGVNRDFLTSRQILTEYLQRANLSSLSSHQLFIHYHAFRSTLHPITTEITAQFWINK
jgi:hypothetical protein